MFRGTVRLTVTFDTDRPESETELKERARSVADHLVNTYNDDDSIQVITCGTDQPGSATVWYEREPDNG